MGTPQEFVLPGEKKNCPWKSFLFFFFFLTSTKECGSWRNTNPAGALKFLKYSNNFNLFSEILIPVTLVDKILNLPLMIQCLVI